MAGTLKRPYRVFAAAFGAALVIGGVSISTVNRGDRHSPVAERGSRVLRSVLSLPRHLRRGDDDDGGDEDRLECSLSMFEFLYDDTSFDSKEVYMCSPMKNGIVSSSEEYQVDLNEQLQEEYRDIVKDGYEPTLSITKATIDEGNARINLSRRSEMNLVHHKRRRRKLLATQGRLTALTIRVILNDGEPVYSKQELYQLMYQDKVSLKNQYKSCSFGKLVIEPSSAGVIEVRVNLPTAVSSHQTVVNAASRAAIEHLHNNNYGDYAQVRDYADMVLYIVPNMGKWLAYGSVGGGTSVYNDKWGGFVASIMHETGHNFNLKHAFEGDEYQDYTGYMGGAIISYHDKVGFPAMCFNAQNHWQLGWFEDRAIETDLFTPTKVRVAAFVDYEKTTSGLDYVLVRSGNVFMHYNRAKAINQDTYEYQDHLVIYQGITEGTYLFAALSYPDNTVYEKSFPQGTWRAEICEKVEGDKNSPDYLVVSIGFGTTSQCEVKQLDDGNSDDADIYTDWLESGTSIQKQYVRDRNKRIEQRTRGISRYLEKTQTKHSEPLSFV